MHIPHIHISHNTPHMHVPHTHHTYAYCHIYVYIAYTHALSYNMYVPYTPAYPAHIPHALVHTPCRSHNHRSFNAKLICGNILSAIISLAVLLFHTLHFCKSQHTHIHAQTHAHTQTHIFYFIFFCGGQEPVLELTFIAQAGLDLGYPLPQLLRPGLTGLHYHARLRRLRFPVT